MSNDDVTARGSGSATSRRDLLRYGGGMIGGALLSEIETTEASAEFAANAPPNVPEWMKAPGDPVGSELYGTPSPF